MIQILIITIQAKKYIYIDWVCWYDCRDMTSNIISEPKGNEFFIWGRKLNTYLVFVTQPYFAVPINVRLISTCYLNIQISNREELQQTTFNHSSDMRLDEFMKISQKYTTEPNFSIILFVCSWYYSFIR